MNEAFIKLKNIIDSSNTLKMDFVCDFVPDMKDARKSFHMWKLKLYGKGTFENKDLIKMAGFNWIKETKTWIKCLGDSDIPEEELIKQKNKEILYYHSRGLTYPYCKHKCINTSCNEEISLLSMIGLCYICHHKEMCKGGLKCNGWMSVKCKYNDLTIVDDVVCQGCKKDSSDWAERGRKINGSGGWFANDRS